MHITSQHRSLGTVERLKNEAMLNLDIMQIQTRSDRLQTRRDILMFDVVPLRAW